MRNFLIAATATVGALAAAAPATAQSLPGVSDRETTIAGGGAAIAEYHYGTGDVLFVRDRSNRWFRIGLNEGCLSGISGSRSLSFQQTTPSDPLDRSTRVTFHETGITCFIDSIRRSEAPPQVNSQSPVTGA